MVIIVISAVVFSCINIAVSRYVNVNLLLLIDIVIWTVVNLWLTRRIAIRESRNRSNNN